MKKPHFEVVRTTAGWHARFRAANGQIVWHTETYTRPRGALRAIALLDAKAAASEILEVDER